MNFEKRNGIEQVIYARRRFYVLFAIVYIGMIAFWMNAIFMKPGFEGSLYHIPVKEFFLHMHTYIQFRKTGMVVLIMLVLGVLSFAPIQKQLRGIFFREIILVLASFVGFFEFFLVADSFSHMTWFRFWANYIPIYLFTRVIYLITNRLKITNMIVSIVCMVIADVNYYVTIFRGTPLMPWDIRSFGTATAVVNGYEIFPTVELNIMLLVLMATCLLCSFVEDKEHRSVKDTVGSFGVILALGLVFAIGIWPNLIASSWSARKLYEEQGTVASFIASTRFLHTNKPSGYTEEKYDELMNSISRDPSDESGESAQNVIVIMNESLADFRVIDKGEKVAVDYMPFINSLAGQENVITGNLYVPVFGANTPNSEFEVLTGASCAYFNNGIPYQTSIHEPIDSMATWMNTLGYVSEGFHPAVATNWNRNNVYSYLGFEKSLFLETDGTGIGPYACSKKDWIRKKISDAKDFEILQKENMESKADKFFMFNVTWQNHGGYGKDDYGAFETTFDLSEYGEFSEAETYMSMVNITDHEFEKLVRKYSEIDEPTVICMFGDHMPAVGDEFFEYLYGKKTDELTAQEQQKKYITPFYIWANYDIEEGYFDKMSANYLGALIMKAAGLPMDEYTKYLWELYQKYPVISTTGIYDVEGNFYESLQDVEKDPDILNYEYLMYHRIKGEK